MLKSERLRDSKYLFVKPRPCNLFQSSNTLPRFPVRFKRFWAPRYSTGVSLVSHNTSFRGWINKLINLTGLRKQPTFCDATTGFPAKWRQRNERRNSILMTRHYPDLDSAFDWLEIASTSEKTDTSFIALRRMYLWRSKTTLDSL